MGRCILLFARTLYAGTARQRVNFVPQNAENWAPAGEIIFLMFVRMLQLHVYLLFFYGTLYYSRQWTFACRQRLANMTEGCDNVLKINFWCA